MLIAFYLFLIYFLIRFFIALYALHESFSIQASGKINVANARLGYHDKKILSIIIPVHSEVDKLAIQFKQWNSIISSISQVHLNIYFVFPSHNHSTKLTEKFEELNQVYSNPFIGYIHDITIDSTKSTKINYALDEIKNSLWIGIIDSDTNVSVNAIEEVIALLEETSTVQLVPISKFLTGSKSKFFYHSMRVYRTILIEQLLGISRRKSFFLRNLLGFRYLCGASMFFHHKIYKTYGPFPVWNDDLYLGYILSVNKEAVAVCQNFSISPFPSGFKNIFWHRMRIRNISLKSAWYVCRKPYFNFKKLIYMVIGLSYDLNKEIGVVICILSFIFLSKISLLIILLTWLIVELIEYFSIIMRLRTIKEIILYSILDHFIILPAVSLFELISSFFVVASSDIIELSKRVTEK